MKTSGFPTFLLQNIIPLANIDPDSGHSPFWPKKEKKGRVKDGCIFFHPSVSLHEVMASNDSRNSPLSVRHVKAPRTLQHECSDEMALGLWNLFIPSKVLPLLKM